MKRIIKKLGKKAVHVVKRGLNSTPKTKERLKRILVSSVNFSVPSNLYQEWVFRNTPDGLMLYKEKEKINNFSYKPLISIIVPTYNTPEVFFREMIESVLSQTYDNWELVIVDDASPDEQVRTLIKEYAEKDSRIVYKFLKSNHHIAGATNEGIKIARGEFVSLFDHDDVLWANALFEIVNALNQDKNLNFIYTDEDKIQGNDRLKHFDPFFKPDWSFDFLRSVNYITHFTTIRKTILDRYGYEDGAFNGAQDWELFLRITRNINTTTIKHIPKIVYSWRVHDNSTAKSMDTKPYVFESQKRALQEDIRERNVQATLDFNKRYSRWSIKYKLKNNPLVSIIIPSKNNYTVLRRCIESIQQRTTYKNYEIIIVDTGSTKKNIRSWYNKINQRENTTVYDFAEEKFSYARACNYGAQQAGGEILIMLNDDTKIVSENWLENMAGFAQQDKVGVVGTMLMYPNRSIVQHATIGVGVGEIAANMFIGFEAEGNRTLIQYLYLNYIRNTSAVTAACLAVRKSVFDEAGGFDEKFRINYNDVDLCLRILEKGYRNVYIPDLEIIHYESMSRGLPQSRKFDNKEFQQARKLFKKRWNNYISNDPHINPNISRDTPNFDVKLNCD